MYTVVVIEDDPSYRNVMEVILQMEGFQVHTAGSGAEGLELLSRVVPDVILCDILMPGMDGHGVLEALKLSKPLGELPFIFVSALADRADVRRGMAAGADDYLTKPFTADELSAAVLGRIRRSKTLSRHEVDPALREKQRLLQEKVTQREREVLLLVGQGATSKQIAEHLKVSLKTVEVHRYNLMKKLDAINAASLSRWALVAEEMQAARTA